VLVILAGVKMTRVEAEQKGRILDVIRFMLINGVSIKELKSIIEDLEQISLCPKTIKTYSALSFQLEHEAKLKEQDLLMKKWCEGGKLQDPTNSEYAEYLAQVFKTPSINDDFIEKYDKSSLYDSD